jgi:hypothetical protein
MMSKETVIKSLSITKEFMIEHNYGIGHIQNAIDYINQEPPLPQDVEASIKHVERLTNKTFSTKEAMDTIKQALQEIPLMQREIDNNNIMRNLLKKKYENRINKLEKKVNAIREIVEYIANDYLISMAENSRRELAIQIKEVLDK